ncbi:ATP-binding protein [bacterium]|nr:ATP-binding protein [bacterium]
MLEQIAKIQNSQNPKLRVEGSGHRELAELAEGYNSLLSEVEQAKASQEELRAVKERLAAAIAGTNDGLWDWDIETGKVWYAPKFKELLSYKDHESEFADTIDSFKKHLHPDDSEATWEAINKHINANEEFDVEKRVRRRRGSYRWFRIRAAGVRDSSGKVVRMSGSIQDVTERKKFEEALYRSNHDLEQFAVIASHDLQEPLRKVASFCGLLKQEYTQQLDETGQQYLDFAIDGASRMSTLVQDLLRYSKIGSETSSNQNTDTEAAVELAIENLGGAIADSQADITFDQLPDVIAEPREIAQLFQNLIGNAIKYRSKESPKIDISVENADDFWQFSVADNGVGIQPEFRDRIFQIFQRLHSRNEHSGTGVGLAICKRVVDRLGGRIWVEPNSAFGSEQGSTFCFTVPKKKSTIYDSIQLNDYYEHV